MARVRELLMRILGREQAGAGPNDQEKNNQGQTAAAPSSLAFLGLYLAILSSVRYSRPRNTERLVNSPATDIGCNAAATNAEGDAFFGPDV